jgi:type IV pilus assembly protein PilC
MRNIPASEITQFLSELATLLRSNHSCQEALKIIQHGLENQALSQLIATVHSDVERGLSLADSLAKYPQYFEPFLVTMLRDEENLATTLFKIAEYREAVAVSTTDLAHRLRTSLSHFVTLFALLLTLMALMLVYVVPVFADMFKPFGGNLPFLTQSVLNLSRGFIAYWWLISGSAVIIGGWWWIQRQSVTLHVPLLGRLYRKMVLVRFLRTCAFMLSNHASLVEALQASAQAVHNPTYAKFLRQLTEQVIAGTTLAEALLKQPAFPAEVAHAAAEGTQVNQLDKWFMKLAEVYTQQLYQDIVSIIACLEPIALSAIGVLVGGFILAMYLPFRTMCENI